MYLTNGKFTNNPINDKSVDIVRMERRWMTGLNNMLKEIYKDSFKNLIPSGVRILKK